MLPFCSHFISYHKQNNFVSQCMRSNLRQLLTTGKKIKKGGNSKRAKLMWPSNIFYVETFSLWEELLFFIICIYLQRRSVLPSLSMEAKPSHSPFMSLPSNKFRIESKKCLYLLTSVIDGGSDLSFKHKTLIVNRVMETCRFFPSIYPKISQKRKWIAFMIYDGKQKRTEKRSMAEWLGLSLT